MIVGDAMDGDAIPTSTVPDSSPGLAVSPAAADLDPDVVLGHERAAKLGRYVLLERLGAGAMGVVFAAYDPELDRKVAIKLLRGGEYDREHAERRLLREARALARLAHPNVVAVHDAGTVRVEGHAFAGLDDWEEPAPDAELVFIAMEFVDGVTLRSWLADSTRTRDDVLSAFVQAGRGLAAAHAAKIVHRDFKPDNVLVDREGRVRVMDFGLARAGEHDLEAAESSRPRGVPPRRESTITRGGAIAGTPVYMAPEQHLGGPVGPQSDQFAFCVALWEAVYGERPFAGKSWAELAETVIGGKIREPPTDRGVPVRLRRVLERGLARDAAHRFPDIAALLDALASDPRRRWRAIGATLGGLGAIAAIAYAVRPPAIDCEDPSRLSGAWDDTTRAAVASALLATELPYAEDTRVRVEQGLDAYAERWMAEHVRACEPATAFAIADLRAAQASCIVDHRRALAALVEVLSHADADVVRNATSAVQTLPDVARCGDAEYLAARVKPPDDPDTAAAVEAQREQLARATASQTAGAYTAALPIAADVVAAARELAYGPLLAEALDRKGDIEEDLAQFDASEASLREAYSEAVAAGDEGVAVDVAAKLVYVIGYRRQQHALAEEWIFHAQALLRRVGLGGEREGNLLDKAGIVYAQMGDYRRAIASHARAIEILERVLGPDALALSDPLLSYAIASESVDPDYGLKLVERGLAIREAHLGPDHPDVASALHHLGRAFMQRGRTGEALPLLRRALALKVAALGPDHPVVSTTLDVLTMCLMTRGEYEEALEHAQRSVALRERNEGPDAALTAVSLNYLARVEDRLGRGDDAIAHSLRALAILEAKFGKEHPNYGDTLAQLGTFYLARGDLDLALDHAQRALAIRKAKFAPDDPNVGLGFSGLGDVELARGDLDAALEHQREALAILEAKPNPSPVRVARVLQGIGEAHLARGENDLALTALERAATLREANHDAPDRLAAVHFLIARALVEAGRDTDRARTLAEQAREVLRKRDPKLAEEVERFLAALPPRSRG